ncbi:hypothetical protein [Curvivirga aplysinae]|uniref:hypothetical protein n=1 Tax=Curvivirga aplysinae TaxID=2529852 RepID=UPI0012BC5CB2|nr:hypothetical protein [Curvivirga aplysinae]MTI08726.1 hypothetical protein [Curvivirga aplysinae]
MIESKDQTNEHTSSSDEEDDETVMDAFKRREKEKEERLEAINQKDAELKILHSGLREAQARIKRILELQKHMGKHPDVDGKHAISMCISALARYDDEKAIRNALNACLVYLKNRKEREEYEIEEAKRQKELEAKRKEETSKEKKSLGSFFKRSKK